MIGPGSTGAWGAPHPPHTLGGTDAAASMTVAAAGRCPSAGQEPQLNRTLKNRGRETAY
ncbi:protein of unknown function [Methylorubrum extorquens DM4]|uniref:Uncharacterized protein n=1 Tax=Methylorubrum extorquens (strain DSM 6343 / CIP 106787 / DM4) TaxID=661410 RepID=C7C917_METED|nr:protein of unknown function [Methylorubrum extorquens DM4]